MKFNKAAACLVATACTASVFGAMTSVSAAGDLTIAAETKTVNTGSEFTIEISLGNVPSSGVAGLDFAVKYDSSLMTVTGVTEGAVSKTNDKQVEGFSSNLATNITDGAVSVLWATGQISSNTSWIKSDGVLLTLQCKAKADGTAKVEITKGVRKDATSVDAVVEGLKVVNPAVTAGTVTIKPEGTNTDPTTPPTNNDTNETVLGDVNLDKKVDVTDLSVLALALVDNKTFSGQAKINADVTKDGEVSLTDLTTLRQFISKVITTFD